VRHTDNVAPTEGADTEERREPNRIGAWAAHFLLIAALVLLFAEVVLACCFGRYSATAGMLRQGPRVRRLPFLIGLGLAAGSLLFVLCLTVALIEYTYSNDFLGFVLPDGFRGWIEGLLDVPPPAPGESTQWTLQAGPVLRGWWLYPFVL